MKDKKKYRFGSAREAAEKMNSGGDSFTLALPEGVKQFKLKSDKTVRLDIIPFITGKGNPNSDEGVPWWERTFYIHSRCVGPNADSAVCLARTLGKKCPVCEAHTKLQRDPNADEKEINAMRPKQRQLFVVIDTANREAGMQVWDISWHLFGKLLAKRITDAEEGEGWESFWHPDKGFTLKLGIAEKNMGDQTFYEVVSIDLVPRKEQYKTSIVEEAPCLDDCLKVMDYDDLKEKLEGGESDEGSDRKPRKHRDEDEDDEDEEEDDGEGSEDEDSDEEDEDEDGDEDEEDEDEDEEEDEDEDEEDEDDEEDEEDEDEDEDGDEEDEDEEEEFERELPKKKKHKK